MKTSPYKNERMGRLIEDVRKCYGIGVNELTEKFRQELGYFKGLSRQTFSRYIADGVVQYNYDKIAEFFGVKKTDLTLKELIDDDYDYEAVLYKVLTYRKSIDGELFIQEPEIMLQTKNRQSVVPLSTIIRYENELYYYGKKVAPSIRLIGAGSEYFPAKTIRVIPCPENSYILPRKIQVHREEILADIKNQAEEKKQIFFDGPNTRLIDYKVEIHDASEQKYLVLKLGPVGWFDFSVSSYYISHLLRAGNIQGLKEFIDVDEVADSKELSQNKLPNILCVTVTILTHDRHILYSKRSKIVSADGEMLSSSIAENMHQNKDYSLSNRPDDLPAPFRTAIRGISEECSPKIAQYVVENYHNLLFLGMDFDLSVLHPDILFLLMLPLNLQEFKTTCREFPGKDFIEGRIRSVALSDNQKIYDLLSKENWVPGGKASFIRAIEFLNPLPVKT
ncbi:hypothetical protein LLG96_14225 [bacterium]|nr:hypothetical protein [bacterium]